MNTTCPGCETHIHEDEQSVLYAGELWHALCAEADARIQELDDEQDELYGD